MSKRTLYFGNPAYLSLKLGQLVIKRPDEADVRTPIEDLGVVVIDHPGITLTHGLLASLLAFNVAVVTTDEKHMPVGMLLPLTGNVVQAERFRSQMNTSIPFKKRLWQQVVQSKIRNQCALLRYLDRGGDAKLANLAKQVKSGDSGNHESQASVIYWKLLFTQDHFIRRRHGPEPNGLLNYGYAILRAVIARTIVAAGLLPTLGIHHHNRYNAFALADDLMEPYRPVVDRIVVELVDGGIGTTVNQDTKRVLLTLPTIKIMIDSEEWHLIDGAGLTAKSLAHCFKYKDRSLALPRLCV